MKILIDPTRAHFKVVMKPGLSNEVDCDFIVMESYDLVT